MKTITLREGRERSLLRRHPWVFESSIAGGRADSGETVRVNAHDGRFLAWAAYSPASMIRLRAWSFVETEREALRRERRARPVGVEALDGERCRFARLPVEVVLADRHRQRAVGQRHAVGLVALAAEQDLEVVA